MEQQAQIIQDYYRVLKGSDPEFSVLGLDKKIQCWDEESPD